MVLWWSANVVPPEGVEPSNLRFTKPLLYQLSYSGVFGPFYTIYAFSANQAA